MRKIATITMLTLLCTAAFAQKKGSFTDPRDKKTYKTTEISGMTWMAENLNHNAKGSVCPGENVEISTGCAKKEWQCEDGCDSICIEYKKPTAKQIQEKNKKVQANCAKYGRLYDFKTAEKACPAGWHLSNDKEWDILSIEAAAAAGAFTAGVNYYDMIGVSVGGFYDGVLYYDIAGKKLKAKNGWEDNDGNGTDDYGFAALYDAAEWFGGSRYRHGSSFSYDSLKFVRCVQGNSSEEAIAAFEKKALEKTIGKQFNPKINYGSMTDARDKITYKTVKIGEQTWMAENLNHDAKGSRCYKDKDYYCKRDGRLYNWETAKTACPAGWHLPIKGEWSTLADAVGGISTAGTKLKATNGWFEKDSNKKPIINTDDFGFSALPTGSGGWNGGRDFSNSEESVWWNASEGVTRGSTSEISRRDTGLNLSGQEKTVLFSVRCVQGEAPKEAPAPAQPAKPAAQPAAKQAEQPKQQAANEFCTITFPKKSCIAMPKGTCKMAGGKVVDKCP